MALSPPVEVYTAGSAVSASNPFPMAVQSSAGSPAFTQLVNGGANTTAANPQPVQLSQANAAATAANPIPAQLSQGGAVLANSNPIPALVVANGSVMSLTNPLFVSNGGVADSVSKGGSAAAPTAGTAILSLTANQPAGRYKVTLGYCISGAAETNALNLRLSDTSGTFTAVDFPTNNGGAPGVFFGPFTIERLFVNGGTNTIKVTAVATATASTVYAANLTIEQIG